MALFNQDELINNMTEQDQQDTLLPDMISPEPREQENVLKQLTGNLIYSNPIASSLYLGGQDKRIDNPSYDRFSQLKGTEWEPLMDKFIYADSDEEISKIKEQLTKESELANSVMNSGWVGTVGMFAGGLVDPTLMIPIVGAVSKARTVGNIARIAAESSALGAGAMGASELGLQQSQQLRTPEQSLINVASGAVLGGVLGGAVGSIVAGKYKIADSVIKEILKTGELPRIDLKSVGAAEWMPSDASIAGMPSWAAKAMTLPGLRAPIIEGLTSKSPLLKDITSRLFENNLIKERNRLGIKSNTEMLKEALGKDWKSGKIIDKEGQIGVLTKDEKFIPIKKERAGMAEPVNMETLLKQDMSDSVNYRKSLESIYSEYLNVKPTGMLQGERAFLIAKRAGKLTAQEFYDKVARGARRLEKTGDPLLDKAVELFRKHLDIQNKKMKELAEEGNIFEQFLGELKLKGRQSYFTIIPDKTKIVQNRSDLEKRIADYYVQTKGIDASEARSYASEQLDHFIGLDGASTLDDITHSFVSIDKGVKFTKDRNWDVPDTLLEDGLVNDAMSIGLQYIEKSNKMIRFQQFLNDMGERNIAGLKNKLRDEYNTQVTKLANHPEYNKFKGQAELDFVKNSKLLDDFTAIALGQFNRKSPADKALRFLRTYNYLRLMGYIVLSSITDIAMPIFKHGLGRTVMDGYVSGIKNFIKGTRTLQNKDLADIYAALDIEMSNTLRTIMDPDFTRTNIGISGKIDAYGDWASEKFGKLSGIDYWNLMHKRMAARIAQSRIIKDIKNYTNLPTNEKVYLNSLGIGEDNIKIITKELETKAEDYNGAFITNVNEWSNQSAREVFKSAIIKEIDSTIVTPGRGDLPRLLQKSEIVRALAQFKGFFSAMTTKVLIHGLQKRDANTVQGIMALLILGAAQYNLRMTMMGKTPNNDPNNLLVESMNRSGLLGLLGDPIFGLILRPYTTGSRYMNQSAVEYPLGPSASLIKDLSKVYSDSMTLDFDDKTTKAMGHLVPFQNLFWLRLLLDRANGKEENN